MRPPVCLRYAMWTMAASSSDKYSWFEDALYERTRRYLQQDEMSVSIPFGILLCIQLKDNQGHGEKFVSLYHVQAWTITATYEAKKTFFTRAWMSVGRTTRLCQMLGFHSLDGDGHEVKRILRPAKDWIELEERRRAFWAAYYGDRWASSGTGWPMLIDEKIVRRVTVPIILLKCVDPSLDYDQPPSI